MPSHILQEKDLFLSLLRKEVSKLLAKFLAWRERGDLERPLPISGCDSCVDNTISTTLLRSAAPGQVTVRLCEPAMVRHHRSFIGAFICWVNDATGADPVRNPDIIQNGCDEEEETGGKVVFSPVAASFGLNGGLNLGVS